MKQYQLNFVFITSRVSRIIHLSRRKLQHMLKKIIEKVLNAIAVH